MWDAVPNVVLSHRSVDVDQLLDNVHLFLLIDIGYMADGANTHQGYLVSD